MDVELRHEGDLQELDRRIRSERHAAQRDRWRAVRLALGGEQEPQIRKCLGRSKNFVQRWVYAYRDGGIEAVAPIKAKGQPPKLPREQEPSFCARIEAGPTEADGVCAFRGRDVVRILQQEYGAHYTLQGAYDLLHRLGYAWLSPRPRHRKNDPEAMRRWCHDAPFLSNG